MDTTSWKSKFTKRQLEKKRFSDRTNQRRLRQHTKKTISELEERIQMLLEGQHDALEKRLAEENTAIQGKIRRYETKIQGLLSWSRESLDSQDVNEDSTDSVPSKDDQRYTRSTETQDKKDGDTSLDMHTETTHEAVLGQHDELMTQTTTLDNRPEPAPELVAQQQRDEPLPQRALTRAPRQPTQVSIIFQAAPLLKRMPIDNSIEELLSVNFIESIMIWKLNNQYYLDCNFIISHFELHLEPECLTTELIRRQTSSPDFFARLVRNLCGPPDTPFIDDWSSSLAESSSQPSFELKFQRRATALCIYTLLSRHRAYFKSNLHFICQFWILYRYATFIALPTEQNLKKTPPYMLPDRSQFIYEHSSPVDFLPWPALRSVLTTAWRQYDIDQLIHCLIQNYELSGCGEWEDGATTITAKPDFSDVEIDPRLETKLHDLRNIRQSPGFAKHYPEFAHCVGSSTGYLGGPTPGRMEEDILIENHGHPEHAPPTSIPTPSLPVGETLPPTILPPTDSGALVPSDASRASPVVPVQLPLDFFSLSYDVAEDYSMLFDNLDQSLL